MTHDYLIESDVEIAAIEWLVDQGYTFLTGADIHRNFKKVVLEDRFRLFLQQQYPHLPQDILQDACRQFLLNEGADLDIRNRSFHIKLSTGINISWLDHNGKEHVDHLYGIDYDHPENNEFLAVNQFTIEGRNTRRADLVIFVNGLPLVLFEFKNMFDTSASVDNAYNQIQHYKKDIPLLFEYNAITVISDGITSLHGMYTADIEWFSPWKSVDGRTIVESDFQLQSLVQGLLTKDRLLQYIRFFIFHESNMGSFIKKGARYHQFFGIQFAVEATKKAIKPTGDGRIGVIWHTQGSGKSVSMAIFTGILLQMPELKNPTIVVQVDRNDLDQQLYENFLLAKDLVGDVKHADSTDELRAYLAGDGGGIIFSTIEKFRLKDTISGKEIEHPVLSSRDNVIVLADECHRTQYGLLDGFANNLRRALPNASFIGFTGTPVDKKDADTVEVFGEVIHTYDIRQAVEDNATVRIFYEPRLAKLHLANEGIDEEAEEIVGTLDADHANRLKWAAVEDAAGSDERVQKIATDVLAHYLKRSAELEGKAMIVCMSRRNCIKMYDAITQLTSCPEVAVVMTGNISKDPTEWNKHFRTKDAHEAIKKRFKKPDDPLKIVIVRDMWLTGFDAPCLHTMYVDKIMQDHSLMQAIARVNRVFKDKPNGLIVDYIGIGDRLKDATKKYTKGGGTGNPTIDTDEAFEELLSIISDLKTFLPEGFEYSDWRSLSTANKILLVSASLNHIIKEDQLSQDFMLAEKKMTALTTLVKAHPRLQEIATEILFFQHLGIAVHKVKAPPTRTKVKAEQIKDLIHRSIESEDIIDVYAMAGVEKPDISILTDEFLLGAKVKKSGMDIKIEILRQILNNEIQLRRYKNIIKYTSLKEEVEKVIQRYHDNAIDSYATILELIKHAKEMTEEDQRTKQLGLTEEELAFYEILAKHQKAITDNKVISELVKEIVQSIKKNLQIDWYKKPDTRAQIMLAVKKTLRGKITMDELKVVMEEIMEQATERFREWSMEVA
ncbi:MAG: type I restriction endonuclease subunit R [Bacteroidales bacterium]